MKSHWVYFTFLPFFLLVRWNTRTTTSLNQAQCPSLLHGASSYGRPLASWHILLSWWDTVHDMMLIRYLYVSMVVINIRSCSLESLIIILPPLYCLLLCLCFIIIGILIAYLLLEGRSYRLPHGEGEEWSQWRLKHLCTWGTSLIFCLWSAADSCRCCKSLHMPCLCQRQWHHCK